MKPVFLSQLEQRKKAMVVRVEILGDLDVPEMCDMASKAPDQSPFHTKMIRDVVILTRWHLANLSRESVTYFQKDRFKCSTLGNICGKIKNEIWCRNERTVFIPVSA